MKDTLTIRNPLAPLGRLLTKLVPKPDLVVQNRVLERIVIADQHPGQEIPVVSFEKAYQAHSWIYSCVRIIATNGAQVPFYVYSDLNGIKLKVLDNPISILLNSPNPQSTASFLKTQTFGWLELTGNAYWYLAKDKQGVARAIVAIRPDRVEIHADEQGIIDYYNVTIGSDHDEIPASDMVHFKQFNPYGEHYGQSTLQAARDTLVDDTYAKKFNTAFFRHGARPGGVITYPQELTDTQFSRVKTEIREGYEGAENAHKILVLDANAKWETNGLSQKDMDFVLARRLNREEIGSVFGVPPVMIFSYENANYNTAKVQRRHFWQETMLPKLVEMRETLSLNLWKFGVSRESKNMYIAFDAATVPALQEAEMEKQKSLREDVTLGLKTINEVRSINNLRPVPWGDVHLVQAGMQAATTAITSRPMLPNGTPAPDPEKEFRGYTKERRELEWKGFVQHSDFFEPLFRRAVVAIFNDQERHVIAALRGTKELLELEMKQLSDADVEAVLFDLDEANESVAEKMRPIHQRIFADGGRRGMQLARVATAFDMTNPRAERAMLSRAQRFAKHINETTWETLRAALADGVHHGSTIQELEKIVREKMSLRKNQNSYTIARTEVIGSLNEGVTEGYKQSGVVELKQWVTAGDEHVRNSHEDAGEQEPIPLTSRFQVGGYSLDEPGDSSAPPEEICNCRCTTVPVLEEQPAVRPV